MGGAFDMKDFVEQLVRRRPLLQQSSRLPRQLHRSLEVQPYPHRAHHRRVGLLLGEEQVSRGGPAQQGIRHHSYMLGAITASTTGPFEAHGKDVPGVEASLPRSQLSRASLREWIGQVGSKDSRDNHCSICRVEMRGTEFSVGNLIEPSPGLATITAGVHTGKRRDHLMIRSRRVRPIRRRLECWGRPPSSSRCKRSSHGSRAPPYPRHWVVNAPTGPAGGRPRC